MNASSPRPAFPFFVGCARSGTTLLRAMFDSHPEIAVPPESYFVAHMGVDRSSYEPGGVLAPDLFLRDLFKDRWFQRWSLPEPDVIASFQSANPETLPEAVRCVFWSYAAREGKRAYGDKTPTYVLSLKLLARLFPEARFVHLIRDGRNVALSLVQMRPGPNELPQASLFWKRRIERGRRAGLALGPERYREVRYEDLIDTPKATLCDLCEFLSVSFDESMLRYYERYEQIVSGIQRPERNHRYLAYPPTKKTRDWRQQMDTESLGIVEALIGPTLLELGYQQATTPSVHTRLAALRAHVGVGLQQASSTVGDLVRRG